MRLTNSKAKGQILPVTLGLAVLVSVTLFMVINSHRAVDEKINLVNAADATAFSGAQMAARELNFMALTNRAMIANEIAIGHMMAYQTELDLLADTLKNGVGGLVGSIISTLIDLVGGDVLIDNFNQVNRIWSGAYILAVNANNALFQDYQEDDYRALAGLERDDLLNSVMGAVSQQYVFNPEGTPRVRIEVNTSDAINGLEETGDPALLEVAQAASINPFCNYILFARPAGNGQSPFDQTGSNRFSGLGNQCRNYYENGTMPNSLGSLNNPVQDGGVLVELLNRSANNATSADWVMRRNFDYRIFGVRVERRGESEARWDNGQINWETVGADTIDTRGWLSRLLSFHGEAAGNAKEIADEAASSIGGPVIALLRTAGLCESIDCDSLSESSYTGIQRYAMLNPLVESASPTVTAVLVQKGNCNDDMGRQANGEEILGWTTNMPFTDQVDACSSQKEVYAYAQAKVVYQRPSCGDLNCTVGFSAEGVTGERPNLFNPFWQAKLANPITD